MKTDGDVEVHLHIFSTSALEGGEWSASHSSSFISGKRPYTHWIGGWMYHRTGLDAVTKRKKPLPLPEIEFL
jgi:hypothetical protein